MDPRTLAAYDAAAAAFAKDWHEQPPPTDLHALVRQFFRAGSTADIGCGSGREVAWLCANGIRRSVMTRPRRCSPRRGRAIRIANSGRRLPELAGVADAGLRQRPVRDGDHASAATGDRGALARLVALLKPGGILYLSWRVSHGAEQRDRSRLYTAFDKRLVLDA